jgi:hypothetical protein
MPGREQFPVGLNLLNGERARSYEAHVSAEDVQQLGQFVQAALPEDGSDPCDSGIAPYLEKGNGWISVSFWE